MYKIGSNYILLSRKRWSERSFTSITVICVVVVLYIYVPAINPDFQIAMFGFPND